MSFRNKKKGWTQARPFEGTLYNVAKLEQLVINKTIKVDFAPLDVATWLFGTETVNILQAAYPLVQSYSRGGSFAGDVTLNFGSVTQSGIRCSVRVDNEHVKMCSPDSKLAKPDFEHPRAGEIANAIEKAFSYHMKFQKIRQVIAWLNDHSTIGAARHYCPWLVSILPAEHPFNDASGITFKEPSQPMADILPIMRECGVVIASALLCGDPDKIEAKDQVDVMFRNANGTHLTSSYFGIC